MTIPSHLNTIFWEVTEKPTILVAGGEQIKSHLEGQFPPPMCTLATAENMAIAMERAPGVTAVVVGIELFGAKDLCIRLRSDPLTSQIPLVFVVNNANDAVGVPVDASVLSTNLDALVQTLQLYCPSLNLPDSSAPKPALVAEPIIEQETTDFFDDGSKTVVFRRPEAQPGEALEWPPPPPQFDSSQDMVDFTQNYAGYMNSLMEALEDPSSLSPAEVVNLHKASKLTMDDVEVLLGAVQTSINEALMGKDLVRMRVLSSAKNSIYEKRQAIRTLMSKKKGTGSGQPRIRATAPMSLLAEQGPAPAPIPRPAPVSKPDADALAGAPQHTGPAVDPVVARAASAPGEAEPAESRKPTEQMVSPPGDGEMIALSTNGSDSHNTKSKLTLAAEAKEKERRRQLVAARKSRKHKQVPKPAVYGSAAKNTKPGYTWVWICVTALLVLVSGFYVYYHFKHAPKQAVRKKIKNSVPLMKWVILDQSTAGVMARIKAEDKEKDQISYAIRWFVNNKEVPGQRTTRLRPDRYKPNDMVYAEVIPTDLYGKGLPMRSREIGIRNLKRR